MSRTGAFLSWATNTQAKACTSISPPINKYAPRQLPTAVIKRALVLTASARIKLCCERPTELICAYWRGAAHCCSSNVRAGVAMTWQRTRNNLANSRKTKPVAKACMNRKGRLNTRDTRTTGTGRKRENQAPNGNAAVAAVIHQTPWSNPAWSSEIFRSSRINGRNRPKV